MSLLCFYIFTFVTLAITDRSSSCYNDQSHTKSLIVQRIFFQLLIIFVLEFNVVFEK